MKRWTDPRVVDNDAIVVLCIRDAPDSITHLDLRRRAQARGFDLSQSACHNMLHRATGRVMVYPDGRWRLTVQGMAYRNHVLATMARLMAMEQEAVTVP